MKMKTNKQTNKKKPMGLSKRSAKGKVQSNTILPQKKEKNQINSLTLHLKQLEKEELKTPELVEGKK